MPGLLPSGAIMGVVAYGEVRGSDGASPFQNSGHYATARTGTGVYTLTPTSLGNVQTDALSQCYVQLKLDSGLKSAVADTDASTPPTGVITIRIRNAANQQQDSDFSFIVLRSSITPPEGSPA